MTTSQIIAQRLNIPLRNVDATLSLLADGATIPFISRYRKEVTGSLDEVTIFEISKMSEQLEELANRKAYIYTTIESQGKLSDDLKARILETYDPAVLEDIYLPYKPKRRTRAQIARERGLEPLADMIMEQRRDFDPKIAGKFLSEDVKTADDAIAGASDIIAERVSESPEVRAFVRNNYNRYARIAVQPAKGKEEEAENYRNYFGFSSQFSRCSSHQILAIMRGMNEGLLKADLSVDEDRVLERINTRFIKRNTNPRAAGIISAAIADSFKRLIRPSIENETMASAKERADDVAIKTFADNLRQLLLAAPLGSRRILAIDPGFRTGCKVVCLDSEGNLLHNDVIYPTPPKSDTRGAARKIANLVEAYRIDAISLGNGTASRETERFLQTVTFPRKVDVFVVNENGASVYSASKLARDEFPEYDVTVRGAVSIGRRLMDPLAELVKIDPKSIGVGQYQHDVDQKKLKESLDATVEACVNSVGVDLNTASPQLLSYIAGIGESMAKNIVDYRTANGRFASRKDLMKVPRFGSKAFQQAAGFLRIPGAANILDNTAVHPESYHIVEAMAKDAGVSIDQLVKRHDLIASLDLNRYVTDTVGIPTLNDIVAEIEKPGRDPREKAKVFQFDDNINTIEDLAIGMELPGIVNNITDFGAFIDIGIHESGLVHLSQLSDKYIRHPSEAVKLNQHVRVKVIDIDLKRRRISLSMKL